MNVDGDPVAGRSRTYRRFAVFWLVLLAFPWIAHNDYLLNLGNMWLISVILIASLNLLLGYGGQISLSHAAFFGLGAYVSGVLAAKYGVSPWLGIVLATVATSLVAFVIGWPSLRLEGHYLAMATVGFNAILTVLFTQLWSLTGGPNGLLNVPSFSLGRYELDTGMRFFYLGWLCAGLVLLLILNLIHSRMGRALRGLASKPIAAQCAGVDVHRYKVLVFVISAAMASVAGTLYVHHLNFASPETFDVQASVMLLVMVAIGGTGTFWGPLLGALLMVLLPEVLRAVEDLEILIYGIALIVVLMFLPRGLVGAIEWLVARPAARRRSQSRRGASMRSDP